MSFHIIDGNYSEGEIYTLTCTQAQEGVFIGYVRGVLCTTLDDFYREISASMRFPYYFGWNWAAFDECISDLEWLSFKGIMIIIDHFDIIFGSGMNAEAFRRTLRKHLALAGAYWSSKGVPITIICNHGIGGSFNAPPT